MEKKIKFFKDFIEVSRQEGRKGAELVYIFPERLFYYKRDDESKTNEDRAAYRSESSGIDSSYAACKKFVRGTMYNRLWLS